jgi:outer membrane protein TolC
MLPLLSLLAALVAVPADAARPLTFDRAIELGRKQNLDLGAARARLDQSRTAVEASWAALVPTVTAQGRYTHNDREVAFRLPGAPAETVIQQGDALDGVLAVQAPLVVPGAYPQLSAAKRSVEAARANTDAATATVLLAVAQAFYAAAGADELVTAREHAVEVTQRTLTDARTRFDAGRVTRVEVMRAEVALVRAQQAVLEAAEVRDQAYRGLGTLIQLRGFKVAPPAERPTPAVRLEELDALAASQRPELAALEATLGAAELRASAQRWRWAPTLSAFGQLRGSNTTGFSGDQHAWAVGLQLDWLLYDGGLRDAERHLAEAEGREAALRHAQQKSTISDEVRAAHRALDTRRAGLAAATRAFELSKQTLELFRVQYEAGSATQLDLLQAQDGLVGAEVALAQARFELSLADVTLRRAAGQFPGR